MFPASPAETRRSISSWITLHRLTGESRTSQAGGKRRGPGPRRSASIACVVPSVGKYTECQGRENGESDTGRLDGKAAGITGATSGIGLRSGESLVGGGARIVIAGRRAWEGWRRWQQL